MCEVDVRRGFIYGLRNVVNDKWYVGQHIGVAAVNRWNRHVSAAFGELSNRLVCRALRKYGVESFTAEVLWAGLPDTALVDKKEQYFIRKLRSFVDDVRGGGYNLTTGGQFRSSKGLSIETRAKLSESAKRAIAADPALRANRGAIWRGKALPETTRRKIAEALLGHTVAETTRAKISATKKANPPSVEARALVGDRFRGKPVSDERRAHLSRKIKATYAAAPERWAGTVASATGRAKSDVERARLSAALKGRDTSKAVLASVKARTGKPLSAEHRNKISGKLKGRVRPLEECRKASESLRGRKCAPHTPEQCAAMSARVTAWWVARKAQSHAKLAT